MGHIDEVNTLSFHVKQIAVLWMDWNVPIGTFHIKFGQKCTLAEGHEPTNNAIYLHVLTVQRKALSGCHH